MGTGHTYNKYVCGQYKVDLVVTNLQVLERRLATVGLVGEHATDDVLEHL